MTIASQDARFIALRGRLVPRSVAVVSAALERERGEHPVILVDSPGGLIEPASAIGRLFRDRGLKVAVGRMKANRPTDDAQCDSACLLLLAAGTTRSVGPDASVGLHRIFDWTTYSRTWDLYRVVGREVAGREVVVRRELVSRRILSSREVKKEVPASGYATVRTYLAEMGISPDLVKLMLATPAGGLESDEIVAQRSGHVQSRRNSSATYARVGRSGSVRQGELGPLSSILAHLNDVIRLDLRIPAEQGHVGVGRRAAGPSTPT